MISIGVLCNCSSFAQLNIAGSRLIPLRKWRTPQSSPCLHASRDLDRWRHSRIIPVVLSVRSLSRRLVCKAAVAESSSDSKRSTNSSKSSDFSLDDLEAAYSKASRRSSGSQAESRSSSQNSAGSREPWKDEAKRKRTAARGGIKIRTGASRHGGSAGQTTERLSKVLSPHQVITFWKSPQEERPRMTCMRSCMWSQISDKVCSDGTGHCKGRRGIPAEG